MKQIRTGVFETNSSSTHSICIAKEATLDIPATLRFHFGQFGWECDTLRSTEEKASYLYTGLWHNDRHDDIQKVIGTLAGNGVAATAEEAQYDGDGYSRNVGYVDHGNELGSFLDAVVGDSDRLMRFLFSDLSFIITGNDNDDEDVDIHVEYAHEEYFKGN